MEQRSTVDSAPIQAAVGDLQVDPEAVSELVCDWLCSSWRGSAPKPEKQIER
jgi:hypothetical protein